MREQLEQQSQQTQAAMAQLQLAREQLAAEQVRSKSKQWSKFYPISKSSCYSLSIRRPAHLRNSQSKENKFVKNGESLPSLWNDNQPPVQTITGSNTYLTVYKTISRYFVYFYLQKFFQFLNESSLLSLDRY